eukprot:1891793-Rhodomonas_salina.3
MAVRGRSRPGPRCKTHRVSALSAALTESAVIETTWYMSLKYRNPPTKKSTSQCLGAERSDVPRRRKQPGSSIAEGATAVRAEQPMLREYRAQRRARRYPMRRLASGAGRQRGLARGRVGGGSRSSRTSPLLVCPRGPSRYPAP